MIKDVTPKEFDEIVINYVEKKQLNKSDLTIEDIVNSIEDFFGLEAEKAEFIKEKNITRFHFKEKVN